MQLSPFDPATIYIGAQPGAEVVRSRPLVSADQPRPHDQHRSRNAVDHGRRRQGHQARQARRRRLVRQHRHARGIGGAGRAWSGSAATTAWSASRRTPARRGPTSRRRFRACRSGPTLRTCCRRARRRAPPTSRSTAIAAATTSTYVFTTTDFGATWRSIAGNLPQGRSRARDSRRIARTPNSCISAPKPACG